MILSNLYSCTLHGNNIDSIMNPNNNNNNNEEKCLKLYKFPRK